MRLSSSLGCLFMLAGIAGCQEKAAPIVAVGGPTVVAASVIDQGRYVMAIGSCNNCHTPGFAQSDGDVPETERLTGNPVGYGGPWGVTYAPNLRMTVATMPEDEFVTMLATRKASPPMPWASVRAMSESDKRAVYRYIKSLGPGGTAMPAALPPGVKATTPVENMMPVMPDA